jgi:hypothetical protein
MEIKNENETNEMELVIQITDYEYDNKNHIYRDVTKFTNGILFYEYENSINGSNDIDPNTLIMTNGSKYDGTNIENYLSLSEYRKKVNPKFDPKFLGKLRDEVDLNIDRVWIYHVEDKKDENCTTSCC